MSRYAAERVPRLHIRVQDDEPVNGNYDDIVTTSTDSSTSSSTYDSTSIATTQTSFHASPRPAVSRWSSDTSRTASPIPTTSKKRKVKERPSIFSFFSVKEPSHSALKELTKQQKQLGGSLASGRPSGFGTSMQKLPADVPKVNSKWDGMPNHFHTKERRVLSKGSSDTGRKMTAKTQMRSMPTPRRASADEPRSLHGRNGHVLSKNFTLFDNNGGSSSAAPAPKSGDHIQTSSNHIARSASLRIRPDPRRSWSETQLSAKLYGSPWQEPSSNTSGHNIAELQRREPLQSPISTDFTDRTSRLDSSTASHDHHTLPGPVKNVQVDFPQKDLASGQLSHLLTSLSTAPQTPPDSPQFTKRNAFHGSQPSEEYNPFTGPSIVTPSTPEPYEYATGTTTPKRPQLRIVTEGPSSSFLDPATPGATEPSLDDIDAMLVSATPATACEPNFDTIFSETPEVPSSAELLATPNPLSADLSGESFWFDNDVDIDDGRDELGMPGTPVSQTSRTSNPSTAAVSPVSPLSPRMPNLSFVTSNDTNIRSSSLVRGQGVTSALVRDQHAVPVIDDLQWPLPAQGILPSFGGFTSPPPPSVQWSPPRRPNTETTARKPRTWRDDNPPAPIPLTPPPNFSRSTPPRTSLDGVSTLPKGISFARKTVRSKPVNVPRAHIGIAGPPGRAVSRAGTSLPSIPEADTASLRSRSDSVYSIEAIKPATAATMGMTKHEKDVYSRSAPVPLQRSSSVDRHLPANAQTVSSKERLGLGSKVSYPVGTAPWVLHQAGQG